MPANSLNQKTRSNPKTDSIGSSRRTDSVPNAMMNSLVTKIPGSCKNLWNSKSPGSLGIPARS